jgi:type I restriction enzyme R subunit
MLGRGTRRCPDINKSHFTVFDCFDGTLLEYFRKVLQRIDKEMSGEAREQFAHFVPDGDVARFAQELPAKLANDFTASMQLLRNPAFQDLLINYPRPPKTFVVAYPTEDTVSSEWLIKGVNGKEYKPEDYIVNLSIDRTDFESNLVLFDSGGWKLADRNFGGHLEELLYQINEALAA